MNRLFISIEHILSERQVANCLQSVISWHLCLSRNQTDIITSITHFRVGVLQGRIQDFKLGGGGALKKIAPSGGRREHIWGISCEKSRFYANKIIFFPILGGGGGGGRPGCAPGSPLS